MRRRVVVASAALAMGLLANVASASAASLADLGVAATAAPSPAIVGAPLTYTVTVSNLGPGGVMATLNDALPSGLTANAVEASQGQCVGFGTGSVDCDLGRLAAGARATVTIVVRPLFPGTLTNVARAGSSDGIDLMSQNDSAQTVTQVGRGIPGGGGSPGGGAGNAAPVVTGFALTRRSFRVGAAPTAIRASGFPSAFRFALSETATVGIMLEQRLSGGRYRQRGTLTRLLREGANSVAFSGRYGSKALRSGNWRATITAVDLGGAASAPHSVAFKIL